MSGHSKWATIKRKKGATDAARGKLFSKCIKEITIAARHGGGDLGGNPRLRSAIAAAKAINMPSSNVERAIKRGTGEIEGAHYDETQYEGYGPGGVGILVEIATDNKNRTAGEIRQIFTKHGGALGEAGSVAYLFKPRGVIVVDKSVVSEDDLMETVLDAGADDVVTEGEGYEVLMPPGAYEAVKEALAKRGVPTLSADLTRISTLQVPVSEKEAGQLLRLVDALEDHDDVQKVYANFNVPDEILARLAR
ncbi:MAG TPA: YebC/PmpR family DNA-binding transcriptional regulator [Candidatus Eisenbacteria bacterium]|jgi:YebC/PmpR family DNA-binding regulatory protein